LEQGMPVGSGGRHEVMRPWVAEEDEELLRLIASQGAKWKLIAAALRPYDRTPAMVRNRYLRIKRGRWLTEQGRSKNRCGVCGQLKRGHICKGTQQDPSASAEAPEAIELEDNDDALSASSTVDHFGSAHGSDGDVICADVDAAAGDQSPVEAPVSWSVAATPTTVLTDLTPAIAPPARGVKKPYAALERTSSLELLAAAASLVDTGPAEVPPPA